MARRSRRMKLGTPAKHESKLNQALLAGKSIKGLVGFVNIGGGNNASDSVYAKVECIGFTPAIDEDNCSCRTDLKIRGKVVGTGSVIEFSACEWLDTLKEVQLDNDLNRRRAHSAVEYRALLNHHYLARKRLALQAFILDRVPKEDAAAIREDLKEKQLDLRTLDEPKLKEYARTACLVANGLTPDQAERWYD